LVRGCTLEPRPNPVARGNSGGSRTRAVIVASDWKCGRTASGVDCNSTVYSSLQVRVCRAVVSTSRIDANRIGDTEVTGHMTANWPAAVVYVLILAFFVVAFIGIALGVYATKVLKKAEIGNEEKASLES